MARRDALQLAKQITAECGRKYRVWLHDPGWLILHEVDAGLRHWYWWETDEPIDSDANRERLASIINSEHVRHT